MHSPIRLGRRINNAVGSLANTLGTDVRNNTLVQTTEDIEMQIITHEPSVSELYELVTSLHRSIESNHVHLISKLDVIEKVQKNTQEQTSMVISAIAFHPVLRGIVIRDTGTSDLTRTVIKKYSSNSPQMHVESQEV
jgi:hypothetical protein